ncbi:pyridoxamine 5'-phosphate oxidase family protein [Bacteroidales bacterium OttesenSCG-928-M11]|nr:pyridoxamine 5'-phosphate oxidase family protein [Bacteroidales bacterium OttesenSCG-928-M11]
MNKAIELLRASQVFFLATTENDQPRVRPFGAVAEIENKVYICTSDNKNCYKQMINNPKVEMAGMLPDGKWVRVCGIVDVDSQQGAKIEFLNQNPFLKEIYKVEDPSFAILYFVEGTVEVYGHTGVEESFSI